MVAKCLWDFYSSICNVDFYWMYSFAIQIKKEKLFSPEHKFNCVRIIGCH